MTFNSLRPDTEKESVKHMMLDFIASMNMQVVEEDFVKPWGGYFRISDENLSAFIDMFFPDHKELKNSSQKLRPKFLIVAPNMRLSWQYHHRRSEVWYVVFGPVKVAHNVSDEQPEPELIQTDEFIEMKYGERHRLIGADNWGIVAEIWKHTDPANPSEESDIVRLQDDFGR